MAQIIVVLGIIKFLHDLFTATWIGGLLVMVLVTMPGAKAVLGRGPDTKKVMDSIQQRMNRVVWISIIGLLLTGILLGNNSPLFEGFFSIANEYSSLLTIKHVLIVFMILIVIVKGHILKRFGNLTPPTLEKYSRILMVINLILGLVVMLLSGLIGAVRIIESPSP